MAKTRSAKNKAKAQGKVQEQALRLRAELAAAKQCILQDPVPPPSCSGTSIPFSSVPPSSQADILRILDKPGSTSLPPPPPPGPPHPASCTAEMRALTYDNMVSNLEYHFHQAVGYGVARLRQDGPGMQEQDDELEEEVYHLESLVFWRTKVAKRVQQKQAVTTVSSPSLGDNKTERNE